MKTESEQLFEAYLCRCRYPFQYEPDASGQASTPKPNPDYHVVTPFGKIICEVKELSRTNEERRILTHMDQVSRAFKKATLPWLVDVSFQPDLTDTELRCFIGWLGRVVPLVEIFNDATYFVLPKDGHLKLGKLVQINRRDHGGVMYQRTYSPLSVSGWYPAPTNNEPSSLHGTCEIRAEDGQAQIKNETGLFTFALDWRLRVKVHDNVSGSLVIVVGPAAGGFLTVKQLRDDISAARKQLKAHAAGNLPRVIVEYARTATAVSDQNVFQAMLGNLGIRFDVSALPHGGEPKELGVAYGSGGKLQPKLNTSISAIVLMRRDEKGVWFTTFHNPWAKHPLGTQIFCTANDCQYVPDISTGIFQRLQGADGLSMSQEGPTDSLERHEDE